MIRTMSIATLFALAFTSCEKEAESEIKIVEVPVLHYQSPYDFPVLSSFEFGDQSQHPVTYATGVTDGYTNARYFAITVSETSICTKLIARVSILDGFQGDTIASFNFNPTERKAFTFERPYGEFHLYPACEFIGDQSQCSRVGNIKFDLRGYEKQ